MSPLPVKTVDEPEKVLVAGEPLETQEILFGGDGKRIRANPGSCRMPSELLGGNGEVC
jgi:hypothetical protein